MSIVKINLSTILGINTVDTGTGKLELIGATFDNTQKILTTNGNTASNSNILVLGNNQSVLFRCRVLAKEINSIINVGSWLLNGQITRGSGVSDIVLNEIDKNVIFIPTKAIGDPTVWDVTASTNNVYGGLNILFTGDDIEQVNVKCVLEYSFVNI